MFYFQRGKLVWACEKESDIDGIRIGRKEVEGRGKHFSITEKIRAVIFSITEQRELLEFCDKFGDKKMTVTEVATELKTSRSTVNRAIHLLGLQPVQAKNRRELNSEEIFFLKKEIEGRVKPFQSTEKNCPKCHTTKQNSEFPQRRDNSKQYDRPSSYCFECQRRYSRQYYFLNKNKK